MSVTIRDVAQQAGVSVATVSRVINNSGPVSEATRQRVVTVASALRYLPNGAARSLITRRTSTLGVLLPDLYGEFFSEVIRGLDQTALRAMRGRVDGLIVMSPDLDAPALAANLPETLPVVLLNCQVSGSPYDSVNIDNFAGAYALAGHLLEHGHRGIAFITGPARNHDAEQRLQGYRAALQAWGVEGSREMEVPGDFTDSAGYDAVPRILALAPRPTAIFAANDATAIGALGALREAGVRVPEEMAVAGFDDIPMARYMSPPLTTVHVAISELGVRAVEQLLLAVAAKNQHQRRHERRATTLVTRRSCGCAQPERPGVE